MCEIDSLVILVSEKEQNIFCWYENKQKNDITAMIFGPGTVGIYRGIWHTKTNGLTWHKIMIGYKEYLFTLDQFEPFYE